MPIEIPSGVKVNVKGAAVSVTGPKGSLEWEVPKTISVTVDQGVVKVARENDEKACKSLHGLTRALIANMVTGTHTGFFKELEIVGTGYRASLQGRTLQLDLGFTHPNHFSIPDGIEIKVEKGTQLTVSGFDKALVGETTAKIRSLRPPEPYKGKGIRYKNEQVRRKVGKRNV
jgi:large subunit ribosomal protein L6